ncbi:alpha-2,3-sialyltransferase [Helicobacter baculiformis]|uniref:Alpha-2,3-sialyltransferase n=1 Tax=Helicobacter baculiformis TaxID=427351 RepID=A0ABV7ZG66_9HELI|nr:alpha-2,3-sialyltransferase [Helicobacter baculiformis]
MGIDSSPKKKPLIIAGNGPSIKELDYSLFPPEFEVFRCNQFYLEDKYYLGRHIQGVFYNPSVFNLQMNITKKLIHQQAYQIHRFYCNTYRKYQKFEVHYNNFDLIDSQQYLDRHYVGIRSTYHLLENSEFFFQPHALNVNFYDKWYTTGVLMPIIAIILGYTEIYLVGIDFYKSESYFYPSKILPTWEAHSEEIDMQGIQLAKQCADLYTLVPNSPLATILPLSPHKNALSQEEITRLELGATKSFEHENMVDMDIMEKLSQLEIAQGSQVKQIEYRRLLIQLLASYGITTDNGILQFFLDTYKLSKGLFNLLKNTRDRAALWKCLKSLSFKKR